MMNGNRSNNPGESTENSFRSLRKSTYEIIFRADSPYGKFFDEILLAAILCSVVVVMLESVSSISRDYHDILYILEWTFTILFTVEYLLRLYSAPRRIRYARSFFGIIDLLAIIPTYLSLIFSGAQMLLVIRIFRVLRIFRIFKLTRYLGEAKALRVALSHSRYKISVFLTAILSTVVIVGALMHLIEGPVNGFTSIPRSIYWAIVTMTTVGYGDIAPQTITGQFLAALLMIMGYGVIAVPTGIVSAEMVLSKKTEARICPGCGHADHEPDASFCKKCGAGLGD
jgi:voltage-gated potassium channel